jgi:hypothetical protein
MAVQTRDVNGTAMYFYEFRVNRSEPVERAVERLTRRLRRNGVVEERIAEADGRPRVRIPLFPLFLRPFIPCLSMSCCRILNRLSSTMPRARTQRRMPAIHAGPL